MAEVPSLESAGRAPPGFRRLAARELVEALGLRQRDDGWVFIPVARADDLVLLEVGWRGLELQIAGDEGEWSASLATDGVGDGVLIVRVHPSALPRQRLGR